LPSFPLKQKIILHFFFAVKKSLAARFGLCNSRIY